MQKSKHVLLIAAHNQDMICAVTHVNYNITKGIEISNDSRYRPVGNSNYPQRAAKQRADHTKRGRKNPFPCCKTDWRDAYYFSLKMLIFQ